MTTTNTKLVVVGNGMAGARAVEDILARAPGRFDITIFGEEPHGNYNRIMLSGVLNGTRQVQDIFLNPLAWYRDNGIKLHAGARVASIDRDAKIVIAADGTATPYDQLILATGSRPLVPPMEGLKTADGRDKPGVFTFRTLDDCTRIAGYASKCNRAAVIGGGLLGLEAARGLLNQGAQVHVVHLAGHLMEVQLDPAAGAILQTTMEKLGVVVHLRKSTKEILGEEMVSGLRFADESTLDCDMVVISCGIRPNRELAAECGLTVERAIVVDDQMRCVNDPNVYAVGECAQHRGRVYGLVTPIWEQTQVLADHLSGKNPNATYAGSKLATKLKVMGVELCSMGITEPTEPTDEVVQFAEPSRGIYKKMVIRENRLMGAILLGDQGDKAADLMQLFDRNLRLPEDRLPLLFDFVPGKTKESAMLEMPDSAQICNCNGVNKGTIRQCVLAGNRSMKSVMDGTRAGTGCGSCKPLVQEIIEWVNEGPVEEDAPPPQLMDSSPRERGGLTPGDLRKIADMADHYRASEVRLDGDTIDLLGVCAKTALGTWGDGLKQ